MRLASASAIVGGALVLAMGSCGPSSAGSSGSGAVVVPGEGDAEVDSPARDTVVEAPEASEALEEEPEASEGPPESAVLASEVLAPPDRTPEDWPSALPWVDDERLSFVGVERSTSGEVRVSWDAPSDMIEGATTHLVERLHAEGYEDARRCETLRDGGTSCSVARGDQPVVVVGRPVIGDPESAEVVVHHLPAGHRVLRRLPGACVKPPQRARTIAIDTTPTARSRSRGPDLDSLDTGPVYGVNTWNGPDLDGDGVGEVYVPRLGTLACPWDIPYDVYVMRGSCGHRVGTVVGDFGDEVELAPFAKGLRTIETSAEWSDRSGSSSVPMHITLRRRYAFDGRRIRKVGTERDRGKCHHCSVVSSCRWAS